MSTIISSLGPDTTTSSYPASYPLHKPELVIGKRLDEDISAGGALKGWRGEVVTEKTYTLLTQQRTRAGNVQVIETTPASIGNILDQESNITDRSRHTHWALRGIIDGAVSSAQQSAERLSQQETDNMLTSLDTLFAERTKILEEKGLKTPPTESLMRRMIFMRLRTNPIWLFSLDRLNVFPKYLNDAVDLALLATTYADRQKLAPNDALIFVLGALLRDIGVGFIDPSIVQGPIRWTRAKEDEAIFQLQSVIGYFLLWNEQILSLMVGYAHEWESSPYGMRSCFKSLRRLGDKDALAGLDDDAKQDLKSESAQRNDAIQKNAHTLHLLSTLNERRARGENPIQIALSIAQENSAFLMENPDMSWIIRSLISPDGVITKKDMVFGLTPAMQTRNKYNATLCQEASEAIKSWARMHPNFWVRIVAVRQSNGAIMIEYQLVQMIPWRAPINIAEYVDTTKLSVRTLTGGKNLADMTFEMELPELGAYYQKPRPSNTSESS